MSLYHNPKKQRTIEANNMADAKKKFKKLRKKATNANRNGNSSRQD